MVRVLAILTLMVVLLGALTSCDAPTTSFTVRDKDGKPVATSTGNTASDPSSTAAPLPVGPDKVTADKADSVPLVWAKYDPAVRRNIEVALKANDGRMSKPIRVDMRQRWAFGKQLGNIEVLTPQLVADANGGSLGVGWGDLAARFLMAWKGLGMNAEYTPSNKQMIDVDPSLAPAIWLGDAEEADLTLVNSTPDTTIELKVEVTEQQLVVHARVLHPAG